jgi:hypothetical protein
MSRDPWLDPLRTIPAFNEIIHRAAERSRAAGVTFEREKGPVLLGLANS